MGCWPRLPLIIDYYWGVKNGKSLTPRDEDNVLTAFEDPERVRCLGISVTNSLLENLAVAMRKPFPELTHLCLSSQSEYQIMLPLPDEFLAGSAPELWVMELQGIPFPGLPQLLLSTRHLVDLRLLDISNYDHFSPRMMFTTLAALTEFRTLFIKFLMVLPSRFHYFTPPAQVVLPSLTTFNFSGSADQLEDLLSQFDAPRFDNFKMSYLYPLPFHFQVPQLFKFIGRTQNHDLVHLKRAQVPFGFAFGIHVDLYFERVEQFGSHDFFLELTCLGFSSKIPQEATQIFRQFSAMLSNVDHLSINAYGSPFDEEENHMNTALCLELLRPFAAAVTLEVSELLAMQVARRLEGATEEVVAELMPSLHSLCLKGMPVPSVVRFVGLRQFSGRPVTMSN